MLNYHIKTQLERWRKSLQEIDDIIRKRIDSYPDEFWASRERDPRADMHAFMQYPAMMVPDIQTALVKVICEAQTGVATVLDPFVGAATTMTSCMSLGLDFTGQDINPLAVLISRAKMGPFDHEFLGERSNRIAAAALSDKSETIETNLPNIDKWFTPIAQLELSKIRRAVRAEYDLWARRFFWVVLAETVRLTSNSRTSTYKLHTRPAEEIKARQISPINIFQEVAAKNIEDMKRFRNSLYKYLHDNRYTGQLTVHLQDTSEKVHPPPYGDQYDLLVTSPPYGDNLSTVTYGQFSYLPLHWIDLRDIDEKVAEGDWLRTTQEIDRKSLGGTRSTNLESTKNYLTEQSGTYQLAIEKYQDSPRDRSSRVTTFLSDLEKTLQHIVEIMRPNAYLIWIVGNRHVGSKEIPTDEILQELLEAKNVTLIKRFARQILHRRMAVRNRHATMMRKEYIMIFRKQSSR